MICPKCGSNNIKIINQQVVKGRIKDTRRDKGFGFCKACIGTCILGPYGLLCGGVLYCK